MMMHSILSTIFLMTQVILSLKKERSMEDLEKAQHFKIMTVTMMKME
jgi:hypothetical protein